MTDFIVRSSAWFERSVLMKVPSFMVNNAANGLRLYYPL
jgi:hypothetical protein